MTMFTASPVHAFQTASKLQPPAGPSNELQPALGSPIVTCREALDQSAPEEQEVEHSVNGAVLFRRWEKLQRVPDRHAGLSSLLPPSASYSIVVAETPNSVFAVEKLSCMLRGSLSMRGPLPSGL